MGALLIGCLVFKISVNVFVDNREQLDSEPDSGQTVVFYSKSYQKEELSDTTIEWLNWYNELFNKQQVVVSYVSLKKRRNGNFRKK